ncbi:hypothetical protein SPKIRA_28980 [Sphingomonas paucimobilis]|nr:hypothetical protein SPKIRA_28980 [Sphingomonas paucimobilis]
MAGFFDGLALALTALGAGAAPTIATGRISDSPANTRTINFIVSAHSQKIGHKRSAAPPEGDGRQAKGGMFGTA